MAAIFVFLGGGIGALLRYFVSLFTDKVASTTLPMATLISNVVASFLLGVFAKVATALPSTYRLLPHSGVSIMPGMTSAALTPYRASSTLIAWVKPLIAYFVAPYTAIPGEPKMAADEEVVKQSEFSVCFKKGIAA